jgi:hypothetical protein
MATPIYKLFRGKFKEAWHRLSPEEQSNLFGQVEAALEKVGGKTVVFCDSSWASEEWLVFGVEEFPDIEAVQQHAKLLGELNWYRYVETSTLLGTAWEPGAAS